MTVKQTLARAREELTVGDIEDASLEAELLLRDALKISRTQLYLALDRQLRPEQKEAYWQRIERRLNHEPSAYITGHREFYGLDFYVDSSVLIPRPESELLVETALELARNHTLSTIAEVGTGCGAIAVSLALSLPHSRIYATDISPPTLKIAQTNCRRHRVEDRVRLLCGDMLDPLPEPVDLVVANLPYVRESELLRVNPADFEPGLALNGGSDGLEKIRRLCLQVSNQLRPPACLLLEIGEGQGEILTAFLQGLSPSAQIEIFPDLRGIDRVVSLTLSSRLKGGA